MGKLINNLKKYKELYTLLTVFATACGLIWGVFGKYQEFLDKNEDLYDTIKTTQQMALKSVIWNDDIPLAERTSACDVYLGAGYNSYTKKHCEKILEESR